MCEFSSFKYVFNCDNCGKDFGANRRDYKFCSSSCGQAMWRRNNADKIKSDMAKWNAENPDKLKQYKKNYKKNNPEKIRASKRERYIKNPSLHKASSEKWREKNIERVRVANREWREKNPEKLQEYGARKIEKGKIKKSLANSLDAIMTLKSGDL